MNTSQKSIITSERLINLFSLFVIGTTSYVFFLNLPKELSYSWWDGFLTALILITFLSYEIVLLYIIGHYITKGKEGFRPWSEVVAENNAKPKTVSVRKNGKIIDKKTGY